MFAAGASPVVRWASAAPVVAVLGIFCFEWYCFNILLAPRSFPLRGVSSSSSSSSSSPSLFGVWPWTSVLAVGGFNVAWALALWSYVQCAVTDPGRVPADWREHQEQAKLEDEFDEAAGRRATWSSCEDDDAVRRWRPSVVSDCRKCQAKRPERAHHCAVCGGCVMRMDHHCPWIGNCVGLHNHKFFILMCFYSAAACAAFSAAALPFFRRVFAARPRGPGDPDAPDPNDPVVVMLAAASSFAASLGFSVAGLFFFHLQLAVQNRTTIETNYPGRSPYNLGARKNLEQLFGVPHGSWLLPLPPHRPIADGLSYPTALLGWAALDV